MIRYINMHSETQFIMLKSRGALNEIPIKSKVSSQKIWPSFMYHKDNSDVDELSPNQANNLSVRRLQDERSYSTNIGSTESFHCAIGPILSIAQIFGVFPVSGVRSSSPSKLQFKTFSFVAIYSSLITVMVFLVTIVSIIHMLKTLNANTFHTRGGIGEATIGTVFYGNSLLGNVLFFWLSSRWVTIQCEWRAMEQYIDRSISQHLLCRYTQNVPRSTDLSIVLFAAYLVCTQAWILTNLHRAGKPQ